MRWIIIALLLLAACQTQPQMQMEQDHMSLITSEEQFIVNMIPHHQEAVDTAKLMLTSNDPEMPEFASNIITAQEAEIVMMNQWLSDWYPEHQEPMYMKMMPDLEPLDPDARDYAFLFGMIDHHKGAVSMAEQVLKLNPRPEVKTLAENIITDQNKEIEMMQSWLE